MNHLDRVRKAVLLDSLIRLLEAYHQGINLTMTEQIRVLDCLRELRERREAEAKQLLDQEMQKAHPSSTLAQP